MRLRHRRATAEYQNELNEVFNTPKMTKSLKALTKEYEKLVKVWRHSEAKDPWGKPYKDYTLEEINARAEEHPVLAAEYLKNHPLFNEQHVQTIAEKDAPSAIRHLSRHKLLNANHIQTILENYYPFALKDFVSQVPYHLFNDKHIDTLAQRNPESAVRFFANMLTPEHIDTIAEKGPQWLSDIDHNQLNARHIEALARKSPSVVAEYFRKHPELNAQHIQIISDIDPNEAAYYLKDHPLFNQQHVDSIAAAPNVARLAARYLEGHPLFNTQHMQTIAENSPTEAAANLLASANLPDHQLMSQEYVDSIQDPIKKQQAIDFQNKFFDTVIDKGVYDSYSFPGLIPTLKKHRLFNDKHVDTIVQKLPEHAAHYLKDKLNEDHVKHIVKTNPEAAREYLKDHPYYQKKYLSKPISFSSNTEKLRKLRDIAESWPNNGVIHAKQFAKYGLNENAFGIAHLKDAKGNYSTQAIQNHIDSLPKHSYYYSKDIWEGDQRHTDKPQNVFQLNITPEIKDKLQNEGVLDTFNEAHNILYSSGHPVHKGTLGWVRYNKAGNDYHIDEVQTDLSHNNLSKLPAIADSLHSNQKIDDNKKNELLQLFTPDKLKKMHNILFSGQHPSKLIHEAFLQHMRDKGKFGSWFHIWQAEPKAELANQDMSKDLPVHMKVGYDEVPIKMGYEAATYGDIKPQTDKDLHGAPTWQAPLRKSLKTLMAEYEELQKVRFENNTHYPEMKDALNNTPHPIKPHLVAFVARNGQPVWRYNDKVSAEEDSRLRSLAAGGLGNKISKLSGMNQRHVRELVTNLLQNPDRHAISANTDPSKPKDHVELRARHLSNALIGKDGYSIADHPEGIEIVAPRHSQSTQTKDYATSWVYNTQTKQLKSLRHYPKSVTG